MSIFSVPSRSLLKNLLGFRSTPPYLNSYLPRISALTLILVYIIVTVGAYRSTLNPAVLTLRFGQCEDIPCVTWIMPAGKAWDQGARPSMEVISIDGKSLIGSEAGIGHMESQQAADLMTPAGHVVHVELGENPIGKAPVKFTLWILGGMFALLGAVVVVRRPDLHAARAFGIFSGLTAVALAVAPSSGGPGPVWALVVQALAVIGVGGSLLFFVILFLSDPLNQRRSISVIAFVGLGFIIATGYVISVLFIPSFYELVRPAAFLYLTVSVLGSIGLLAIKGVHQQSPLGRQQTRIALGGITLGTLPFVILTLIPEAAGIRSVIPSHLTILATVLIPAAFVYAILQHQLLGIRKLVHRGIVYGVVSLILLVLVMLALTVVTSIFYSDGNGRYSLALTSGVLVAAVILLMPLRRGVRWVVDKLIYKDVADIGILFQIVPDGNQMSDDTSEVASSIVRRLAEVLSLEGALLFLHANPNQLRLVASAGERSEYVAQRLEPQLQDHLEHLVDNDIIQIRLESDSLILAPIRLAGQHDGCLVLGPKQGGEIFLDEERRLLSTLMPLLTLAIEKSEISEELRTLNHRLMQAEEMERTRIAADLHDGPLQKAILLTKTEVHTQELPRSLANSIISEIREICSRLRPAILDDLGIVSALDWLLEGTSKISEISTTLSLNNLDEGERFEPDIEQVLFRVTQEAMNNVIKHAKATRLDVVLSKQPNEIMVEIIDDGIGFHPPTRVGGGFGISGMRERVYQVRGSFDIVSAPGSGTTIIVRIPFIINESLSEPS